MSQYYKGTPDIPKYIFLLEDAQRKAARAHLPITNQTLTILASTALLAADTFPRTTELWEEFDPANKTWAAWKTAYLAAHKKRANHPRATGGVTTWAGPTQPTPPPSTLASSTPSNMPWTFLPVLPPMGRLSLSSSLPLTPLLPLPTPPSPTSSRFFATNSQLDPGVAVEGGGSSNVPNQRRGPDPASYCWYHGYRVGHGHTGDTCSNPKYSHQPIATCNNIMGGSIANKDWAPNRTT
jgi:hypothetical protein